MSGHLDRETLNDLLDGSLGGAERHAANEHLDGCGPCRAALHSLRETVEALHGLPREAMPPAGTWMAIRERIGELGREDGQDPSTEREADILPLPGATGRPRRLSLSFSQLAAAAALVALLSGGLVWSVLSRGPGAPAPTPVATDPIPPMGAASRAAATRDSGYEDVIRELSTLVEEGRDVLTPETQAVVERSLATVDSALAEVRQALAEDPGSDLLQRMLVDHQTTKVRVLRQAATAIEARS
jgi:anti-sigma factor RsiW